MAPLFLHRAASEPAATVSAPETEAIPDQKTDKDPFDEIDFGTFFR